MAYRRIELPPDGQMICVRCGKAVHYDDRGRTVRSCDCFTLDVEQYEGEVQSFLFEDGRWVRVDRGNVGENSHPETPK